MPKTFPIELDADLHKRAKIAAIQEDMTLHDWIINTLEEKLSNGTTRNSSEKRATGSQRSRSR